MSRNQASAWSAGMATGTDETAKHGRWLNGLVKGDGAAHEMSCAIGELLRTLHMLNEGDSR